MALNYNLNFYQTNREYNERYSTTKAVAQRYKMTETLQSNNQTTTTVGQPTPMKPSYEGVIIDKGALQHSVTPNNPTAVLLEVSDEPPRQSSLEKFERTPLQHQMLKAYMGNSPQQDSGYPSTANLPTPLSRHTGTFGSVLVPIQVVANVVPHQVLHLPTAAGPFTNNYYASFSFAQPPIPRQPDTSTHFIPAGRSNAYMSKLKKQIKQKRSTATAGGGGQSKPETAFSQKRDREESADPEEIAKGRQNMRKYQDKASSQPNGYSAMVSLNGGDCIGEQNLNVIEKCIGISNAQSPKSSKKPLDKKTSPQQQPQKKENVLKNLQEEQREIEAKLKFIDSLINQQAPTSSFNVKYLGGGILKRQRTDDFVINLEQYQKAMLDLKQTMDNLKVSTVEDDAAGDGEVEMYHRYQPVIAKSQYSDEQTENQTYQQQIEEALTRQHDQAQSRQRLIVPQSEQKTQIIQSAHEDFDRSVLSNPSSNRLKEATLHKRSYDSHRNKESFRSVSFVLQNKMDNIGQPETNYPPGSLSPDKADGDIQQLGSPERGETGRERPQSCTLRVIKEVVIINGKGEDEDQGSVEGAVIEGENNRYRQFQPNLPVLDMTKINMVFDQAAAPKGIEHTKQTLYDSKQFQVRTQVNHPNFKGEKVGNHKGGILINDETHEEQIFNGDLMHIQNVLPLSKGLEIRPSKTPQLQPAEPLSSTSNDRNNSKEKRKLLKNTSQGERPTTVPDSHQLHDQNSDMIKKPGTSMGSTYNHFLSSQSAGLDKIDENVVYQQDEDNTRGVLYFKNLDSLKSFIMSKKRPIFSKQGNRIISNTVSVSANSNWSSQANLVLKKKPKGVEELKNELEEDIQKKRQFLHRTLSTLMPQLQLKALLEQEKKLSFQQTIDFVKNRMMGNSPPGSAPLNGQSWAPISSQQPTLYNPIPKTSYLFDDIMTADGIIDLRFMSNTPANTFYKPRLFSRQENVSSSNNLRSETSPAGIRKTFPKRLQHFYQFSNLDNLPQSIPQSKQGQKPGNQESRRKSRNALGNAGSDTLSDSHYAESSQNVTRQVVFFKTTANGNPQNMRTETGGSYNMQYPQLRPRLNQDQVPSGLVAPTDSVKIRKSLSKGASSLTVQHHQKYIKTGAVTTSSVVQIPTTNASQTSLKLASETGNRSPEVVLNPQPNLLRMSKDIEKSKIRDSQQSFGLIKTPQLLDENDKIQQLTESLKLRDSRSKMQTQPTSIKHVIFSTYEGQVKGLQFAKNVRNLAGKKMPPLYPQTQGSEKALDIKGSTLLSSDRKEGSIFGLQSGRNFNTLHVETQGLTTAHSNQENTFAVNSKIRAGTVSPKERQAGQFFSNGGPGSLFSPLNELSPKRKIIGQYLSQENSSDQGSKAAQSGNASKRGDVLGVVPYLAGSNSSQRAHQANKNYIKGLITEKEVKNTQKPGKNKKASNIQSIHQRMGINIAQSKFSNAQSADV